MGESSHKKVIVIGDGCVGKTCFVAKVTENKFIPNYLPTFGGKWSRGIEIERRGAYIQIQPRVRAICGINHAV